MRALWILLFPFALAACEATGQGATFAYDDAWNPHGHARSEAALQVDMRACDAKTGGGEAHGSDKFKACMRAHGWTFNAVESAASGDDAPSAYVAPPDTSPSDNAAQAAIDANNQEAATNAATAAAQQQFNDGIAAAQQQMNNAVFNQQ